MNTRLHTVEEAADILRIGRNRVFKLIATGELHSVKIGRSRRVTSAAIEDFIAQIVAVQQGRGDAA